MKLNSEEGKFLRITCLRNNNRNKNSIFYKFKIDDGVSYIKIKLIDEFSLMVNDLISDDYKFEQLNNVHIFLHVVHQTIRTAAHQHFVFYIFISCVRVTRLSS